MSVPFPLPPWCRFFNHRQDANLGDFREVSSLGNPYSKAGQDKLPLVEWKCQWSVGIHFNTFGGRGPTGCSGWSRSRWKPWNWFHKVQQMPTADGVSSDCGLDTVRFNLCEFYNQFVNSHIHTYRYTHSFWDYNWDYLSL